MSDDRARDALKDLKKCISSSASNESSGSQLPKETEKMLQAIDLKISSDDFQINKSDLIDQQIGRALVTHHDII